MSEKYPYVRKVEISKRDGRRDNAIKSVKMTVYTSYLNDENHKIRFGYERREGVVVKSHSKDYGSDVPKKVDKIKEDSQIAQSAAWDELERIGYDDAALYDHDTV